MFIHCSFVLIPDNRQARNGGVGIVASRFSARRGSWCAQHTRTQQEGQGELVQAPDGEVEDRGEADPRGVGDEEPGGRAMHHRSLWSSIVWFAPILQTPFSRNAGMVWRRAALKTVGAEAVCSLA